MRIKDLFFQRYDESAGSMASYLPWLYLAKENIVRNKDGSLLCAFKYEDINPYILKQIAVSNVSVWIDYSLSERTLYITYNPMLAKADPEKIKSSIERFSDFIESIERGFAVSFLKNEALLKCLCKTVSVNKTMKMPENPIYLDYKLTKNHRYKKFKKETLMIDDVYFKCIKLLGYPDFITKSLILFMENNGIFFRFTRRLIFISGQERKKEIERYTGRWSKSHREFLKVLRYDETKICAYYKNILIVYSKSYDKLTEEIKESVNFLNGCGIPTIEDKANMGDVWYASLPGMFRSDMSSPPMEIALNKDMFFC